MSIAGWVLGVLCALPPGRYVGHGPQGPMRVELGVDGRALLGGAAYRWRADGDDALVFEGPGGRFRFVVDPGPCLVGAPLGRLCLEPDDAPPAVAPEPPEPPEAFAGTWQDVGGDGHFRLTLDPDGRFVADGVGGRWQRFGETLVLTFDVGGAVRYRARREGDRLRIGGASLAGELVLAAVAPEAGPSL